MKEAQNVRVGNVVIIDGNPLVVQQTEYNAKTSRHTSVINFRFRNLLTNARSEAIIKADERIQTVVLETKDCTYSYYSDPMYVFMDEEYDQHELDEEAMGESLKYLEDGMEAQLVFYEGKPISVNLPNVVVREITYTEPGVRGDTSGKVTKPATVANDMTIQVPLFCNIGDKIEIDTRTNEYRGRV